MNLKPLFVVSLATAAGLALAAGPGPDPLPAPSTSTVVIRYVEITEPPATTSTTSSTIFTSSTTTEPPKPIVFPDTPCQEWAPTAVEAGWPADPFILNTLLTIMWRESRCNPLANSPDDDRGLLQIHPKSWCKPNKYYEIGYLQENGVIASCDELYDPLQNLRAAKALFEYSEARGDAWRPWAKTR